MSKLKIKYLALQPYLTTLHAMQNFTSNRDHATVDEFWLLEHPSVFTLGSQGQQDFIKPSNLPTIKTDRGGHITYHGPGQIIIYILLDLKRKNLSLKTLIFNLEQVIINLLLQYNINAKRKPQDRGVFIQDKKIASIGLKIKNWHSYHGISFNAAMDLEPFNYIHPCGITGLKMTQLQELINTPIILKDLHFTLAHNLATLLGYTHVN